MFQPPSAGDFWLPCCDTTLCQSMAFITTLKPALRSAAPTTTGCGETMAMSDGCRMTTGVPS